MYYFNDKDKRAELKRILEEWEGTPYKHKVGVKGLGADCIHFVGRSLEELELVDFRFIVVPDYPRDWHQHNTREALAETIEKHLKVEKHLMREGFAFMDGDIILSHYGKASSHAGIYYEGYVYQALDNIGVRKITILDQTFRKQMKFIYRILA